MAIITIDDLPADVVDKIDSKVLQSMIDGLNGKAIRVAPCLADDKDPSPELLAEAKLILLSAFQRFADAGAGALTQMGAGSFQVSTDTRQRSGYNLWPSEIADLQELCKESRAGKAFNIDVTPKAVAGSHRPWCALAFGAPYCSCGSDIAGEPIYEEA